MSAKAAASTAMVATGTYAVNKYLSDHQVTLNGTQVRFGTQSISSIMNTARRAKDFMGYFY